MVQLLTLAECGRRLSVSRSKVMRLIRGGELRAVKLGKARSAAVRVSEADLDAYTKGLGGPRQAEAS